MSDRFDKIRFEEMLGQLIDHALEHGISADYVRKALCDDWEIMLEEKRKRDRATLRALIP